MTVSDHAMTHHEHALTAYRIKNAADTARARANLELADERMIWAQWHATMAVYELSLLNAKERG